MIELIVVMISLRAHYFIGRFKI